MLEAVSYTHLDVYKRQPLNSSWKAPALRKAYIQHGKHTTLPSITVRNGSVYPRCLQLEEPHIIFVTVSYTHLFPSNHAVGLTLKNGMEILIHVGIDTVNENGNGFTCLCEQGKHVKKGEPLLKMDREYLLSKGYDLSVIVIFTNKDSYAEFRREEPVEVKGGESVAVTYTPVSYTHLR